jgi:hypothetical protein
MSGETPRLVGGVAADLMPWDQLEVATLDLAGPALGGAPLNNFTYKGGRTISNVEVVLIFWGTAWTTIPAPNPGPGTITDSVSIIASGRYMEGYSAKV